MTNCRYYVIIYRLGIAVSTVSKGLNGASDISDDMRQLVLDTAVEMGYASKKLKAGSTRKVCILIENMDYENIDQFGYEIIMGFKLSAARRHWEVSVIPGYHGVFGAVKEGDLFVPK